MDINLITYFNKALPKTKNNSVDFAKLNAEATKYGYIIHPDCCTSFVQKWIEEVAKINYNKTFYKEWNDITSKTRFELLVDQVLHYITTIGIEDLGESYVPNEGSVVIPFENFKTIMPISEKELGIKCTEVLTKGIALKNETMQSLANGMVKYNSLFDVDSIKNKEAMIYVCDLTGKLPSNSFDLLRYMVFKSTNDAMLIKNKESINKIKVNPFDMSILKKKHKVTLSTIFYRFKPLFLAMRQTRNNKKVVNEIRRMAVKNHKPLVKGFWETVLLEVKSLDEVKAKVGKITNFKKASLIQSVKEKIADDFKKIDNQMYVVRNGKMFIRKDYKPKVDKSYLKRVGKILCESLSESIKDKACRIRLPKGVDVKVPTSGKNFIGNYPIGTSVKMAKNNNVIGIYWENAWGTYDFDLHINDIDGNHYGWNSSYFSREKDVIYSGDITNAPNGATELFFLKNTINEAVVNVSTFSRVHSRESSQYKLFVAPNHKEIPSNELRGYMVNPNDVVFECMIPVKNREQSECAVIFDNTIYLVDLKCGNKRVPGIPNTRKIVIEQLVRKCKSMISVESVLKHAGFTIVTDETEEVDMDLSTLEKDSLINLFS